MTPTRALADALVPDWPACGQVGAWMSTRAGGVSAPPFDTLNLGRSSGDDPDAVLENRRRFEAAVGARPVWLSQVHGAQVVRLDSRGPAPAGQADAAVTTEPGIACTVMVADCLPVLFAAPGGRGVGAAHAGWRGLAAGVLDATVAAICEAARCEPTDLCAWLGPCIGPRQFEVGADVLAAFGVAVDGGRRFVPRARPDGAMRWLADLPGLARDRLAALGVTQVSGGTWCTVEDPSRFFSFRRDRVTGRMAAAVWLRARDR
jgi:YfiH family protein